jgi:hypothetical protein
VALVPNRSTRPTGERGLSLAEVRGIAEEVGLKGRFIDQAVASLALDPPARAPGPWGGPIRLQVGHAIPRPLTGGEQSRVLDSIRDALDHDGQVRDHMGGLEWTSVGRTSTTRVTIGPAGEGSKLIISHDASGLAALTWVGSVTSGLVASGILLAALPDPSAAVAASMLVGGGVIGAGVARTIWSRATKTFRRRAEWLRDQLIRQIPDSD